MKALKPRWVRMLNSESGVAMAIALVMIILILIISGTLAAIAMNEYQTAGSAERSRQTIQLTEAAMEKGIFEVRRDPNWADSAAATRNVSNPGFWYALWDGAQSATDVFWPASSPLGIYSIELCRYDATARCPGTVNEVSVPGCTPGSCIWIRATGKDLTGKTSRRIEALLLKLGGVGGPGGVPIYSASALNLGAGSGGNGSFTLHGSFYVGNCRDDSGLCVALKMQGNGAIMNDVPFIGDDDRCGQAGQPPCSNRAFLHGWIAKGQGNSFTVGESSPSNRKMLAVHARGIHPAAQDQVHTYRYLTEIPLIPMPDLRFNALAVYNLDKINGEWAYYCEKDEKDKKDTCNNASDWTPVNLASSDGELLLSSQGGTKRKVLIPDAGNSINCRQDAARCNNVFSTWPPIETLLSGRNDYAMIFNGFAPAGAVNLYTERSAATNENRQSRIYMTSRLKTAGDIIASGFTSIIVNNDNRDDVGGERSPVYAVEIQGSWTPLCRASQGSSCTQTFGRDPSGSPPADTFAILTSDEVLASGSGQMEINLILLAKDTLKSSSGNDQWRGVFYGNVLDFDNNPQIWGMHIPTAHLPSPVTTLPAGEGSSGGGILVLRWREVY